MDREYFLNLFREKGKEVFELNGPYHYGFFYLKTILPDEYMSAEEKIAKLSELVAAVEEFDQEKKKEPERKK